MFLGTASWAEGPIERRVLVARLASGRLADLNRIEAVRLGKLGEGEPDRLAEGVALVKQGQGEAVVLNHIRTHQMQFNLSVADLDFLKSNGVSDRVIAEMQTGGAPQRVTVVPPPRTVVVREEVVVPAYGYGPYWGPPPVVYVRPQPVYGASFNFRR